MNESIAMMANDPSKKLLFDFLNNDQPGKLINSAMTFHSLEDDVHDENQPALQKVVNPLSRKFIMGIDQVTTLSEE